jgi:hypothetical protein
LVGGAPRHKLVLHVYTLLLVLFLLTFTLVATSKVLPASFTAPIYNVPWLFYVAVACVAASLIVMISWNLSSQASVFSDLLLLMLWGGTTLNLILMVKPFGMLAISSVACVTIWIVLILTFCAIQVFTFFLLPLS